MQQAMTLAPPPLDLAPVPLSGAGSSLRAVKIILPGTPRPEAARVARRRTARASIGPLTLPTLVGGVVLLVVYVLLAIVVFLVCILLRDLAHAAVHLIRAPAAARRGSEIQRTRIKDRR